MANLPVQRTCHGGKTEFSYDDSQGFFSALREVSTDSVFLLDDVDQIEWTREACAALRPLLKRFAETGRLLDGREGSEFPAPANHPV